VSAYIRKLAVKLFRVDPPPSARLSHVLTVRQRQVQYWLAGRDPTPGDVIQAIEDQIKAVDEFKLQKKIDSFVSEAQSAGINPSIVAHYLDQTVEKLRARSTDS
jgi:glycerol kinase